jgi:tetrahydromethanopterin S-methyltransferase subunit G
VKAHKQTEDTRLALLEQSIMNINQTLNRMETRFDRLENKMDTGFKDVNSRLWTSFLWMLGLYASTIGIVLSGVYYMINS